jgi:hypothetical protein
MDYYLPFHSILLLLGLQVTNLMQLLSLNTILCNTGSDVSLIILETNLILLTNHSCTAAITAKMSDVTADFIAKVYKLLANQCSYYSTLPQNFHVNLILVNNGIQHLRRKTFH